MCVCVWCGAVGVCNSMYACVCVLSVYICGCEGVCVGVCV